MTLSAIILTYNEEQHIERCIKSLSGTVDEIFVIDSYSTDKTIEIAKRLGAIIFQNPFVNQAVQFNWALKNCKLKSDWILRVDADEYLDNRKNIDLKAYIRSLPCEINGLIIRRKIIFMGKPLLHGGWYPKWNLRIFRKGFGECENRWMDEHIILNAGVAKKIKLDLIDENLNDLNWWTAKHNNYSTREAIDYFLKKNEVFKVNEVQPKFYGSDAERKRWLKSRFHSFPLFARSFLNFSYRYIFRLGFLDGKAGFVWHFLQGFWYRYLVDAKIYELQRRFKNDELAIVAYIKEIYKS